MARRSGNKDTNDYQFNPDELAMQAALSDNSQLSCAASRRAYAAINPGRR
jgi:hypothetical protein